MKLIFRASDRLNDSSAIPGVNPPPPEAASGSGGARGPADPQQPGQQPQGGSGPDYAALLQYLQFYQKQMNTDTKK